MDFFQKLGTVVMLRYGEIPEEMNTRTLSLIEDLFDIPSEKRPDIARLLAPIVGAYFIQIETLDKRKAKKIVKEEECYKIHQDLIDVNFYKKRAEKIIIHYSKGLDTIITDDSIIADILFLLHKLPAGTEKVTAAKGRKRKDVYSTFMASAISECSQFIKSHKPDISERDILFFTGLLLSMAGILESPWDISEGRSMNEREILDIKNKYVDRLKYYMSSG